MGPRLVLGELLVLRTHDLIKRYGHTAVINGLQLKIEAGDIYGFLGPNGAGKTTTIRMLMGIIAADSGSIELFGKQMPRPSNDEKRRIGYVSQDQHFYPWMTASDLGAFVGAFYPTWDAQDFTRILKRLELPSDRKAGQLSRGMQVKLGLALALAHRPQLLILDEPTSGLDPLTRREFLEIIRSQAKSDGRTTFFSTHLIDDLEHTANKIGILHGGRLVYQGSGEALTQEIRSADGELVLPEGIHRIGTDERGAALLRASNDRWLASGFAAQPLSLEDAFVALVRSSKTAA